MLSPLLLPSINDQNYCFETYRYSKFIQVIQEILYRLTLKRRRKQSQEGLTVHSYVVLWGCTLGPSRLWLVTFRGAEEGTTKCEEAKPGSQNMNTKTFATYNVKAPLTGQKVQQSGAGPQHYIKQILKQPIRSAIATSFAA